MMEKQSFTSSDQVARDMKMGVFPKQSERTKHELAERERIFNTVLEIYEARRFKISAQEALGLVARSIAHEIAMKLVPTGPPPEPEYNGGDTPPV